MEVSLRLPRLTTVTALTNIYLVLSLLVVQVYGTSRPPRLESHSEDSNTSTTSSSSRTESKRSLDIYEDQQFFQPSLRFQDTLTNGHKRPEIHRQRYRPSTRQQQRRGEEEHYRDEPSVSYTRRYPYRRQSQATRYRPPPEQYLDFDYNYGPLEEPQRPGRPENKKSNIMESFLTFLSPNKRRVAASAPEPSEPSLEWLYNDISTEEKDGLFIPNNADYDEGNLDYRDPVYDFRDVFHSIRNNESRILTLKKFLSAASSISDRAGTDPMRALTTMPLTILSILGVFYAVSAVAVLAYKYTLLTAGSTNGQAVALIPVAILFALPLIGAVVLVTAQSTLDGRISLTSLARGDEHWLRPDFDSVDFMYDVGVGATAILGLGWVVSVAL